MPISKSFGWNNLQIIVTQLLFQTEDCLYSLSLLMLTAHLATCKKELEILNLIIKHSCILPFSWFRVFQSLMYFFLSSKRFSSSEFLLDEVCDSEHACSEHAFTPAVLSFPKCGSQVGMLFFILPAFMMLGDSFAQYFRAGEWVSMRTICAYISRQVASWERRRTE